MLPPVCCRISARHWVFPKGVTQREYQLACIKARAFGLPFTSVATAQRVPQMRQLGTYLPALAAGHQHARLVAVHAASCCSAQPQCPLLPGPLRLQTSLLTNTLVCLPTGLGKTLIAAVVMHNFCRWFPEVMPGGPLS